MAIAMFHYFFHCFLNTILYMLSTQLNNYSVNTNILYGICKCIANVYWEIKTDRDNHIYWTAQQYKSIKWVFQILFPQKGIIALEHQMKIFLY